MGTEWDKEVVGNVDPQKRVLCLAQVFLQKSPDTPGSPEGNTEGPGTASSEPLLPS